jgi:hypothetical protein
MQTSGRRALLALLLTLLAACSSDSGRADGQSGSDRGAGDGTLTDLWYQGDGACRPGATAGCMSAEGKPAFKVCEHGRWSACTWECLPGSYKACTGGKQFCEDGKWGPCLPD